MILIALAVAWVLAVLLVMVVLRGVALADRDDVLRCAERAQEAAEEPAPPLLSRARS